MGKPLLTDEILEKAKKKQYSDQSSQFGHYLQTRIYQWMMLYSIHV